VQALGLRRFPVSTGHGGPDRAGGGAGTAVALAAVRDIHGVALLAGIAIAAALRWS
jgi:hypothetical protein